jgi:DNA-binding response OmpR family regulator
MSSFPASSPSPTLQSQPPTSRRVLIVEDDPTTRGALQHMFTHEGWQVYAASTIADAMKQLKINPPDFMVLDLMLPDGDGVLLLEHVRAKHPQTRVAVTTGVLNPQWLQRVHRAQPAIVLQKPIQIDDLLTCLRNCASQ